jgi:hypothetical protein
MKLFSKRKIKIQKLKIEKYETTKRLNLVQQLFTHNAFARDFFTAQKIQS